MTPSNEHLAAALRKARAYQGSQWVGRLTPTEAKALVDAGAVASAPDIAWMSSGLQTGSEETRWVYFTASPALKALLRARVARPQPVKASAGP